MQVHLRGILALLIVTIVWGTTFPAMKDLSDHFSAVWIAFLRFTLGGLVLAPFLLRARRADYVAGAVLGLVLFAAFMFQVEALGQMSASRNAFITGLNVLIVPLLGVMAGRMPENRIIIACAAIAAYFWLAETMTMRSVVGGLLLIAGMIVSQWTPGARAARVVNSPQLPKSDGIF